MGLGFAEYDEGHTLPCHESLVVFVFALPQYSVLSTASMR